MAKDHIVPASYLRGFAQGFLDNNPSGRITAYRAWDGKSRGISIDKHAACSEDFYAGHPIDKEWSRTVERSWPTTRKRTIEKSTDPAVAEALLRFLATQVVRNRSYMNLVAADLGDASATVQTMRLNGETFRVKNVDITHTFDVMEKIKHDLPKVTFVLECTYDWEVVHVQEPPFFITCDDPAAQEAGVACFPIALNACLVGKRRNQLFLNPSISHRNARLGEVDEINAMVVRNAFERVFSWERSFRLEEFVRAHHVPRKNPMAGGIKFSNNPAPLSEERKLQLLKMIQRERQKGLNKTDSAL